MPTRKADCKQRTSPFIRVLGVAGQEGTSPSRGVDLRGMIAEIVREELARLLP
jgi:hypothetical protein